MLQLTGPEAAMIQQHADRIERSDARVAALLRRIVRELGRPPEGYLTTGEVADMLDVTTQTVRNWADRGWLPSARMRPTGRRRIPRAAIDEVVAFRERLLREGVPALTDEQVDSEIRAHRQERSSSSTSRADRPGGGGARGDRAVAGRT
jgi:excisionase family DNA binding protein